MNAIVVVDENWKIGRDGGLLVHLSGDLKYFKERTYGKSIVIGRKTLESFPGKKPLPGGETLYLQSRRITARRAAASVTLKKMCWSFLEKLGKKYLSPAENLSTENFSRIVIRFF